MWAEQWLRLLPLCTHPHTLTSSSSADALMVYCLSSVSCALQPWNQFWWHHGMCEWWWGKSANAPECQVNWSFTATSWICAVDHHQRSKKNYSDQHLYSQSLHVLHHDYCLCVYRSTVMTCRRKQWTHSSFSSAVCTRWEREEGEREGCKQRW